MQSEQSAKIIVQREQERTDFVENATVGMRWLDAKGIVLWANQAELDLLGYTSEEYIGHSIVEFHADQEVIEDILKRLHAGEKISNCDVRMRCKDGSIKHVLVNSSVRLENGEFIHTRCFTIDITQRRQVEERVMLLYQLTAALSEALTPSQAAKVIMERCLSAMGASAGSVVLLNHDKTQLEILFATGYSEEIIQTWQKFPVNSSVLLSQCVRSQQAEWLHSFEELLMRFPDMKAQYDDRQYNAWAAIPLNVEKRVIGALGLSFLTPQNFDETDRHFIVALAQQCAQALERTRLSEEALDLAIFAERQRLARELHDSVSQTLFAIYSLAQLIPRNLDDIQQAQKLSNQVVIVSQAAMAEMRTLLLELRPSALINTSLKDLFHLLVNAAQARKQIAIAVTVQFQQTLPEDVHIALYRIAQEAITNMVKHSEATRGNIQLTNEEGHLTLRLQDNGKGFDTNTSLAGTGLKNMRDRALAIGATLEIISQIAMGTEIVLKWMEK